MGKHTPKYLVSHYDELPVTGYWRLGRFITIIVVISVVLIVRQEDPDKIQDARGRITNWPIGVKYAFSFGLFLNKTCFSVPHWPEVNKLWLFIAIDIALFFFKRRHLGQRNVEHFTLPSQHSLLMTGNWSRNGCRELSFTPGHYYVMTL